MGMSLRRYLSIWNKQPTKIPKGTRVDFEVEFHSEEQTHDKLMKVLSYPGHGYGN